MKEFLEDHNAKTLQVYRIQPHLIREHYGTEETVLAGGYGYRQIAELVQNGADAILEAEEDGLAQTSDNRVDVVLREKYLYVGNTGAPISQDGLIALLSANTSPKRGNEIGRFGLGFKSLLRLEGRIEFFSKTKGRFQFNPNRCRKIVRDEFGVEVAPGLRMAFPCDSEDGDAVIDGMNWAETIVRVEVPKPLLVEHLRQEIQKFPEEFLIFLRHSMDLRLDDGVSAVKKLRVEKEGSRTVLYAGESATRWRVVSRDIAITDEAAKEDARALHNRDSVPMTWAYPLDAKKDEAGRFWAFFPTSSQSYLPGILNAPWKLNSDRDSIIRGALNEFLMKEAAIMVADHLPEITLEDDPGAVLDYFPRSPEREDPISFPFREALWRLLEAAQIIPDGTGQLRGAVELYKFPTNNIEIARQWNVLASDKMRGMLVHPSCLANRNRIGRLNQLTERLKGLVATQSSKGLLRGCDTSSWIKLVASSKPDTAVSVLMLAEQLHSDCKPNEWGMIRQSLQIIPDDKGELRKSGEVLFSPESSIQSIPGRHFVQSEVLKDENARRILHDLFGVRGVDESTWESLFKEAMPNQHRYFWDEGQRSWQKFWDLVHSAPSATSNAFLRKNVDTIKVKRLDGKWVSVDEALLPGDFVDLGDGVGNDRLLIDSALHSKDLSQLSSIGLVDRPTGAPVSTNAVGSLENWLEACRSLYKGTYDNSAKPSYLKASAFMMPSGWQLLPLLKGRAKGELSRIFLRCLLDGEFPDKVDFGHSTTGHYPRMDVAHPLHAYLCEWGGLDIDGEVIPLAEMVARRDERALMIMPGWDELKAKLDQLSGIEPFDCAEAERPEAFWFPVISYAVSHYAATDKRLTALWEGAAKDMIVPTQFEMPSGETVELSGVFVTASSDLAQKFSNLERLVFALDEKTANLWKDQGAKDLSDLIDAVWESQNGERSGFVEALPELAEVLTDDAIKTAICRSVNGLGIRISEHTSASPCLFWLGELLIDPEQLAQLSRAKRFEALLNEIASTGWLKFDVQNALSVLGDAAVFELRDAVFRCKLLSDKLLCALGGRVAPLKVVLGNLANQSFVQDCTPQQLAGLVLSQCGPTILSVLRDAFEEEGLKPPQRWNTDQAREFVSQLGFPLEFATSPVTRRDSELMVTGPMPLPRLHDFQDEVMNGIRALANSPGMRRRAVISLPTGGGKTRVTVQAAIECFLKPEGLRRRVIWIAQTDELCEQAVQAFRQVWLNVGAENTDLRVIRLWGGNRNPSAYEPAKPVAVVASIQTLNSRMGADQLEWLKEPGLTVIDECHHAITPSYTGLLRWLDAEAPRGNEIQSEEPVVIGLSATPFRSDDDESHRLARRFDSHWLPSNQEALHSRLRRQKVLSEVDYEAFDSGESINPDEETRLLELWERREGLDFERLVEEINQRLAKSAKRNRAIVEYIHKVDKHSTLFFANSVAHAEEVAARLNLMGISAAAVSGGTPKSARRYFLDKFQRGEIRVICNHSVLTTGFDAPKTDVVIISRQVFSAVRYMQMVGRGLRGEANGGTARCRIVTVMDNLGRFQDRHPYHYCEKYFTV